MLTMEVDWPGLDALVERLKGMEDLDLMPVMEQWTAILVEGNRRGVLSGVDGNGKPMPKLKYRDGKGKRTGNRRKPDFGTTVFDATPAGSGAGDNLSAAEYRRLTGPRLAPQGEKSRVIRNLHPRVDRPADNVWVAVAAWGDVVSADGTAFLPYHFDGAGQEQYDLRPVRDRDYQFCVNAMAAFANQDFFAGI